MDTVLTTAGPIVNESPQNGASNPWECHNFTHQILYTDGPMYHQHLEWYLTGDVPLGIEIDSESGLINGNIAHFGRQPLTKDKGKALEPMKIDGSNCLNNGRFSGTSFTFTFNVHRRYLILDPLAVGPVDETTGEAAPPEPEEEEVETTVSITVIKNHDVDNLVFVMSYMQAGFPVKIGNKNYAPEDFEAFINDHPGPFGGCSN